MLSLMPRRACALLLLGAVCLTTLGSAGLGLLALPPNADAAIPAARYRFDTQSDHVGPTVHRVGSVPAYCLDHGRASPDGRELSRGTKLSQSAGTQGRAISIALDFGPASTSGGTTINGISLTNLEWRMAVQLAIFRIQGESLAYSSSTDHWRASTWIVNRALDTNTVQLNRYWRYEPAAGSGVQSMVYSAGDPLTARVRATKVCDDTGATLSGASFGLWTSRSAAASGNTSVSSFMGRATSNSAGNAWWYRVPVGTTYYVRELSPPDNYELNTTVMSIQVEQGNDSEIADNSLPIADVGTLRNTPEAAGRIELTKQSVSPGGFVSDAAVASNPAYSLAGAAYGVWTSRSAADAKNTSASSYLGQMTTNAQGHAAYDDLRMGNYYVRELSPPAGHVLDDTTHQVTLARSSGSGNNNPVIGRVNSQDARRYGTNLSVQKIDRETGSTQARFGARLSGAVFEIRWADPSTTGGWRIQRITSNAQGRAEYQAAGSAQPGIPLGSFQIREVTPPEGYLLDPEFTNWRTFSFADSGGAERPLQIALQSIVGRVAEPIIRGDIAITKYGGAASEVPAPLSGVRFDIIDNNRRNGDGLSNPRFGQVVGTLTTDRDGYASSRDLVPPQSQWGGRDYSRGFLEYGDYLLSEDASTTPEGLKPIDDLSFRVSENGVMRRYGLHNHEIRAALSIVKRDAETQQVIPVAGTSFQIFDTDLNLMSFAVNYPHSTVLSTFVTDESGQINIPETLRYGDYFLKEVQAPEGYLLLDDPLPFRVERSHDWAEPFVVALDNMPAMGRVRLEKLDSITATAVPGTVFELRAKDDIITGDGSLRLAAGELADILRTDDVGKAESIPLYLGSYELIETENNPWYLLSDEPISVDLRYADQHTPIVWTELTVENEPVQVSCEIEKRTIAVTSAGFKSLPGEGDINNSAQGSKELYRYDIDFKSTSNDWADEYVVFDYLEGVSDEQIRVEELWTPVVDGDSNGLYNLWYQTNLSDETTSYSAAFAASKDTSNTANLEKAMRFGNEGWLLWEEDLSTAARIKLTPSDLGLQAGEYITAFKLEYGRVEKNFASTGAPLSYMVYCPEPLLRFDPVTGLDTVITNTASSHITRNINLFDDAEDTVETHLVDSFTLGGNLGELEESTSSSTDSRPGEESSSSQTSEGLSDPGYRDPHLPEDFSNSHLAAGIAPQTGDPRPLAFWIAVILLGVFCIGAALFELSLRKREKE